jgi:hypothetical protein
MDKFFIVILIPVLWFFLSLTYQVLHLFYLWLKYKFENIKNKELKIWD